MAAMPNRLMTEWQAYFELDPFGGIRGDYHAAMIRQSILNAFRGKDDDSVEIEDCMPLFGMSEEQREKFVQDRQRERLRKKIEKFKARAG